MRLGIVAFAILGLGFIAYLVLHVGLDAVLSAISGVGIGGFLLLCAYGLLMFALLGTGWFLLDQAAHFSQLGRFVWGRAVRDSAGEVLPFSQLGGFVIGARAVSLHGVPAPVAFASTIVDVTTEMMGQIVFVLAAISVLLYRLPGGSSQVALVRGGAIAVIFGIVGAAGFLFVQRRGFSTAERLVARFLPAAAVHASAITHAMKGIHANPHRIVVSFLLHVVGWLAAAGSGWLAVRLIGRQIDFVSIVAIEGMLCAIRSAAVFVPSGYGVQEASYAMLMPLFGLGPDVGLAVSLLRRGRDIALGIPILLAWQVMEGRRALAPASPPAAPEGRA
jgi:putative membrane protein